MTRIRHVFSVLGMLLFLNGAITPAEAQVGAPIRWTFNQIGGAMNKGLLFAEKRRYFIPSTARDPSSGPREGFSPVFCGFGDGTRMTGGLQYSRSFAPGTLATVSGRVSTRLYQRYIFSLTKEIGPVRTGPELLFESLPQEDYYGEGARSAELDRSTYALTDRRAAWATTGKVGPIQLRHSLRWDRYNLAEGTDRRFPTTQDSFLPSEVSGGFTGSQWLSNQFSAVLDSRDDVRDPKSGTALEASADIRH